MPTGQKKNVTTGQRRTGQGRHVASACAVGVLLLLPLAGAEAKTVAFTGTMKTQVDFNRTYTVDVAEPLQTLTLTLSIPMPQSGSVFGYAEGAGTAAVDSSVAPTSETDVTDDFGNALHVLEYDNLPPGTLTAHVNVTGLALATGLSQAAPAAPFPVAGEDAAACLQPTEHVQSDAEAIRALVRTITAGAKDEAGAGDLALDARQRHL